MSDDDIPSSAPPRNTDDAAALQADSTIVCGRRSHRSRSYTVRSPSATRSVENSGLSLRNEPWHATWARVTLPNASMHEAAIDVSTSRTGRRGRSARAASSVRSRAQVGPADQRRRVLAAKRSAAMGDDPNSDGATDRPPIEHRQCSPRETVQPSGRHDHEGAAVGRARDAAGADRLHADRPESSRGQPRARLGSPAHGSAGARRSRPDRCRARCGRSGRARGAGPAVHER